MAPRSPSSKGVDPALRCLAVGAAAAGAGLRQAAKALAGGACWSCRVLHGAVRRWPRISAACLAAGLLGIGIWQVWPRAARDTGGGAPLMAGAAELECLALNIYHEARGESQEGRVAVAQVVLNRVADPRFPNEICAVVKQGYRPRRRDCQFSWWCDGRSDRPADLRAWEESKAVARDVLDGRHADPTGGALWYHAEHVQPKWRMAVVPAGRIGRHRFYLPGANTVSAHTNP